jgi:hypothetical protein
VTVAVVALVVCADASATGINIDRTRNQVRSMWASIAAALSQPTCHDVPDDSFRENAQENRSYLRERRESDPNSRDIVEHPSDSMNKNVHSSRVATYSRTNRPGKTPRIREPATTLLFIVGRVATKMFIGDRLKHADFRRGCVEQPGAQLANQPIDASCVLGSDCVVRADLLFERFTTVDGDHGLGVGPKRQRPRL